MSAVMIHEDDEDNEVMSSTPEELRTIAVEASSDMIPEKSRLKYTVVYEKFLKWKEAKKCQSFSENVFLAYFKEKSTTLKPSTLWSQYSMLKSTVNFNHQVKLESYTKLIAFLKNKSKGFHSKKAETFTSQDIKNFLDNTPDKEYLVSKVRDQLLIRRD